MDVSDELAQLVVDRVPLFDVIGLPPRLRARVSDAYHQAWFVVPGSSSIAFPTKGPVPGQQLGDIIFNFVMGSIMDLVQGRLLEFGVELRFPVYQSGHISNPSDLPGLVYTSHSMDMAFFDDSLFMFIGAG